MRMIVIGSEVRGKWSLLLHSAPCHTPPTMLRYECATLLYYPVLPMILLRPTCLRISILIIGIARSMVGRQAMIFRQELG